MPGRRFYTIFILPHAHARFRKLNLSRNFVVTSACLLAIGLLGGAVTPHLLLKVHAQTSVLSDLEAENRRLREDKARVEGSIEKLVGRIDSIESRATRLAKEVGLDEVPGASAPSGGALVEYRPGDPGVMQEELEVLGARLDSLASSFSLLDRAWEERAQVLAHTPTAMPVTGFFSDSFGWRRDPFTGGRAFHQGIDIVAPPGTLVRATANGVVATAGRMGAYGKIVHLSHGYGLATRYAHLSELLVSPGTRVKRGDPVGRVGSTGRSTGPHLHYEIFQDGRKVNPRRFLGDRPH